MLLYVLIFVRFARFPGISNVAVNRAYHCRMALNDSEIFRCQSGTDCIDIENKCDGTVDCADGSDESHCSHTKARMALNDSEIFRCQSGTDCIDIENKCDGTIDCADGSDESHCSHNKARIEYQSRELQEKILHRNKRQNYNSRKGVCILPQYPIHGTYNVSGEPDAVPGAAYKFVELSMTCQEGYGVTEADGSVSSKDVHEILCVNGRWSKRIPSCVQTYHADEESEETIPQSMLPAPLNDVEPAAQVLSYQPEMEDLVETMSPPERDPREMAPWFVSIYDDDDLSLLCIGTIIAPEVVITSAKCIESRVDSDKKLLATAGQLYKNIKDQRNVDMQNATVAHRSSLRSDTTPLAEVILFLKLDRPFTYNSHVQPVTIDFDQTLEDSQLQLGRVGKYPLHGTYNVSGEPDAVPGAAYKFVELSLTCQEGYGVIEADGSVSSKDVHEILCVSGKWSKRIPSCVQTYHADEASEETIPQSMLPAPLDDVEPAAQVLSYQPEIEDLVEAMSPPERDPREMAPWFVSIYDDDDLSLLCIGTIIASEVVITSAKCIESRVDSDKKLLATAGQLYKNIKDQRNVDMQNATVAHRSSLRSDTTPLTEVILFLKLDRPFTYNSYVQPVTIDFDQTLEDSQLQLGRVGKMGGWNPVTEDLDHNDYPYVELDDDIFELFAPDDLIPSAESSICAAAKEEDPDRLPLFDGSGLVFTDNTDGKERHYLRGILSYYLPCWHHACPYHNYLIFIKTSYHKKTINRYLKVHSM